MNKLSAAKRTAVVAALVEGCSIRATVRMTGVAKNTVAKLLLDLGSACTKYQDETLRNLPCRRLQCDEIWSFVGAKDKNISTAEQEFGRGSVWTWTALCADTCRGRRRDTNDARPSVDGRKDRCLISSPAF